MHQAKFDDFETNHDECDSLGSTPKSEGGIDKESSRQCDSRFKVLEKEQIVDECEVRKPHTINLSNLREKEEPNI